MKKQTGIGRRELFRKLAGSAGAVAMAAALPGSAAFGQDGAGDSAAPASSADTATVRVILSNGTTVQWLAVTSGGLTVGGETTISTAPPGINKNILRAAIQAIVAAGGPQLTPQQVTLLGGKVS